MTPGQVAQLGGQARAKALSPERRKEIARKGAAARWPQKTPVIEDLCDEVHGVNDARQLTVGGWTGQQRVMVIANGLWVHLVKTETAAAGLSPTQARYLASKLCRCADLVEQRRRAKGDPS